MPQKTQNCKKCGSSYLPETPIQRATENCRECIEKPNRPKEDIEIKSIHKTTPRKNKK